MIKLKDELVNFPIIDMEALSKKNKFPENVRTAVSLYNKAIERIRFNSTDIAIIELKKAIKIFPDFYDAILLLGLCYYTNDEKSKSISLLNSIRDVEERNKCMRYLDSVVGKNISGGKAIKRIDRSSDMSYGRQPAQRSSPQSSGQRNMPRNDRNIRANRGFSYHLKVALSKILNNPLFFRGILVIVMLLIAAGAIFGLYTLYNVNKNTSAYNEEFNTLKENYDKNQVELEKSKSENAKLKNNIEELTSGYLKQLIQEKVKEENIQTEYENVVKIIHLIDLSIITNEETKATLEMANNQALLIYGGKKYDSAKVDMAESKYKEAIAQLEDIITYYPRYEQITKVKLDLGKSYRDNGDKENAIRVLDDLVQFHGNSIEVVEAKNILAELNGTG